MVRRGSNSQTLDPSRGKTRDPGRPSPLADTLGKALGAAVGPAFAGFKPVTEALGKLAQVEGKLYDEYKLLRTQEDLGAKALTNPQQYRLGQLEQVLGLVKPRALAA